MSLATAPVLASELQVVINNLFELEKNVHEELRVYRWRPRAPDLPCLWNWMPNGTLEQKDLGRHRDSLTLQAWISIRHTDVEEEMDRLMGYVDAFRAVIDPALFAPRPLGCQRAMRQGMAMHEHKFGETPTLSVMFPIAVQVDRMIYAS